MATPPPPKSRSSPPEASPPPATRPARPSTPNGSNGAARNRPSTPKSASDSSANRNRPSTPRSASDGSAGGRGGTPATPRARKTEPACARPRLSFDRASPSPKSAADRRSLSLPKVKGLSESLDVESKAQLDAAADELVKVKEQLAFAESERERIFAELVEVKKLAQETNEKLQDAVMAKKWAEEATEIEKFRADELEQVSIDEAQRREELWQKEVENVRGQHAADLEALVNATQDLERLKHELAMSEEAKNAALGHADGAMKIAEENAAKVEALSGEVARLKAMLDSSLASNAQQADELVKKLEFELLAQKEDHVKKATERDELLKNLEFEKSALEADIVKKAQEIDELVKKLESERLIMKEEIDERAVESEESLKKLESQNISLREDLAKASEAVSTLEETRKLLEQLSAELESTKKSECGARQLLDELKEETCSLRQTLDKVKQSERDKMASYASTLEKLEESNALLQDKESEIGVLKGKTEALELEVARQNAEIDDWSLRADSMQQEVFELQTTVEVLKNKLHAAEETVSEYADKEKAANLKIGCLTEEKAMLISELTVLKDDGEKDKKAMEDLTIALHEASSEAREAQERFLNKERDYEDALAQIGDLKLSLKNTRESYEVMVDEANYDIACLRKTIENLESQVQNHKDETHESHSREAELVSSNKQAEEEIAALKLEAERMLGSLAAAELQAQCAKEENEHLQNKLVHAETAVAEASRSAEEAKAEGMQLKERLLDKENEFQNISQENDELRLREMDALKRIEEIEATLKSAEANEEQPVAENTCDVPQERADAVSENGDAKERNAIGKPESPAAVSANFDGDADHEENMTGCGAEQGETLKEDTDGSGNVENVLEKETLLSGDLSGRTASKREENGVEHPNGTLADDSSKETTSPTNHQQLHQKKNKPLLKKLGSLLKKNSGK